MILSDREILEALRRGEIVIEPFHPDNLGPCSVDLTLADTFLVFKGDAIIDPADPESIKEGAEVVKTDGKPFILMPKQFVLAYTRERIAISKGLAAILEGRSSVARLGVVVHAAGLVNPGTGLRGPKPLVLEIFGQNSAPVKLYPGMRIVQIMFIRLSSPSSVGYDERPSSTFAESNELLRFSL